MTYCAGAFATAVACAGVGLPMRARRLGCAGVAASGEFRGASSSVTISILIGLPMMIGSCQLNVDSNRGRAGKRRELIPPELCGESGALLSFAGVGVLVSVVN